MQKEEIVQQIKEIIAEFGGFGTGEVEADCSLIGHSKALGSIFSTKGTACCVILLPCSRKRQYTGKPNSKSLRRVGTRHQRDRCRSLS